jgi:hypothetical protein
MSKYVATLAGAFLALGTATGADAMTTSTPAALGKAIQDITTQEQVHCRPGWTHWHPWGWSTGCYYGGYYGGYYPRYYGGYYPYYARPRIYVGPRFYGHYRRW